MKSWLFTCACVGLLLAGTSCETSTPYAGAGTPGPDDLTDVMLELTSVPAGIQCVQVRAAQPGQPVLVTNLTVTAGASSTVLSLGRLPPGMTTFNGSAFNLACTALGTATPLWIADAATATLAPGVLTTVMMTFRPNNPVTVSANFLDNVVEIVAGFDATYARMGDGTVKQWGDVAPFASSLPVPAMITGVQQLAAGDGFACAVITGGVVQCWGRGFFGDVPPNVTLSPTPTTIRTANGQPVTGALSISAGSGFACAGQQNQVLCWGSNTFGTLGTGTSGDSSSVAVSVLSDRVGTVFGGGRSTCVRPDDSRLGCWGSNDLGQIGVGSTNPIEPRVLSSFTAIGVVKAAVSTTNTCYLRGGGTVGCAGDNRAGEIGQGTFSETESSFLDVPGITDAVDLSVGSQFVCALHRNGTVSCWGQNSDGELGDGSGSGQSNVPQLVPNLAGVVAIRSGTRHTCAQLSDLRVMCWGMNRFGQLGEGTRLGQPVPVFVKLQ